MNNRLKEAAQKTIDPDTQASIKAAQEKSQREATAAALATKIEKPTVEKTSIAAKSL